MIKKRFTFPLTTAVLISFAVVLINGCAALQDLAKMQKPQVSLSKVQMVGLDFNKVDLNFQLSINNPNPIAVTLPGFGYDFLIEQSSLVKGQKEETIQITAQGASSVDIPVTLTFEDIYRTVQVLTSKDSAAYKITCDLYFDIPIIGKTPVTVEKEGFLPLPKLPKFKISSLKLKKLSFMSADLELSVNMKNPNSFKLFLNNFDYHFSINGLEWIKGLSSEQININENGEYNLNIPISLSFLQMGRTIYNLIAGDKALNYEFDSSLDVKTSLPLLKEIKLPVNKKGQINILK